MKYCPKCQREYVDTLNFCTSCGTPLAIKETVVEVQENASPEHPQQQQQKEEKKEKKSWGKRILIICVVVVVVIGCFIHYLLNAATYLRVEPDQLVSSKIGGSITVDIDYDGYVWTINHKPEWVDVCENDDDFEVSVGKNTTGRNREGTITVQSGKQLAQVAIVQRCTASFLNVSANQIHFDKDGGKRIVTIESDGGDWTAKYPDYLKVVQDDDETISIKAPKNTGVYRSGYITISEDNLSRTISITQGGKCSVCNGKGKSTCGVCSGTGGSWWGWSYSACFTCGGSGVITCFTCSGTGYKE